MKTEREIYNTIKWDPRYNEYLFFIEYRDREKSRKKVPFAQFNPNGDIPWHRVCRFYYKNQIVWDRENRIEKLSDVHETAARETEETPESSNLSGLEINTGTGLYFNLEEKRWLPVQSGGQENKRTITLMTCNVLCDTYEPAKGYAHVRYPALVKYLKNRADIIHLQEVTFEFAELLLEEPWVRENYYISDTAGSLWHPFGVLTLARVPIRKTIHYSVEKERRPVLISFFENCGLSFVTINLHLGSNRSSGVSGRKKETASFISMLAEMDIEHAVVAGDFNFNDNSEASEIIKTGYVDLDRYFFSDEKNYTFNPEVNLLAKELSPMGTPRRMDRVFLKSSFAGIVPSYFEVTDSKNIEFSPGLFMTDHFPVLCEFDFKDNSFLNDTKDTKDNKTYEVHFCADDNSFPLISSSGPVFFTQNIRGLFSGSVAFETVKTKHKDCYVLSTLPENKIEDTRALLLSCYPGSIPLPGSYVFKQDNEEKGLQNIKYLISYITDRSGQKFPADFLCLEKDNDNNYVDTEAPKAPVATEVIEYLKNKYPVKLMGSHLLHAAAGPSDIDFYSNVPCNELSEALKDEFQIRIAGERTECIKFVYKGFEIDIQFNEEAYHLNKELELIFSKSPQKRDLLKSVKLWAAKRGINKQALGYPGGTAWAIAVSRLEQGDPDLMVFFKKCDIMSLPSSFTETMTESSKTTVNYEINRAKELVRAGRLKFLYRERSFKGQKYFKLQLKKDDQNAFLSGSLKLSRSVERKGGLADIIKEGEEYCLFLFGIKNPAELINTHLANEGFTHYELTEK